MRTAVIRINVDPAGELSAAAIEAGLITLRSNIVATGLSLVHAELRSISPTRRELQFLASGDGADVLQQEATARCREAFGVAPAAGVVTYLSRGTDEDAIGVLANFGLVGEMTREPGTDGWDVVTVRLAAEDLRRVPESRIQTALEACTNCEVRIIAA